MTEHMTPADLIEHWEQLATDIARHAANDDHPALAVAGTYSACAHRLRIALADDDRWERAPALTPFDATDYLTTEEEIAAYLAAAASDAQALAARARSRWQLPAHGFAAAGIEASQKATFVPCDCGCGRSCCAHCGVDVGFVAELAEEARHG